MALCLFSSLRYKCTHDDDIHTLPHLHTHGIGWVSVWKAKHWYHAKQQTNQPKYSHIQVSQSVWAYLLNEPQTRCQHKIIITIIIIIIIERTQRANERPNGRKRARARVFDYMLCYSRIGACYTEFEFTHPYVRRSIHSQFFFQLSTHKYNIAYVWIYLIYVYKMFTR